MKICGFSFIRNGVQLRYPFEESIRSVLPLCDAFYVAVGRSDDDTLQRVKNLDPKIVVLETVWDDTLKTGGAVLAHETNKAFQAIPDAYDWAFYIQGDELIHEKDVPAIRNAMAQQLANKQVDGLLFRYIHFYGGYKYVATKYSWYRYEIRIVRNDKRIYSYRDAQGFRKDENKKLRVKLIDADIYHYGWVREPEAMQVKNNSNQQLYTGDQGDQQQSAGFAYEESRQTVKIFTGVHPAIMHSKIINANWPFRPGKKKYASFKDWIKQTTFRLTGWMPGEYRNYKRI